MNDDYMPVVITYDEITDMWSFYAGNYAGVADTREELVDKIWHIVYNWRHGYEQEME